MPRPLRLILKDVAVHVVQRGHDRNDCFRAEADRLVYLAHLRELAQKHRCTVHAYCLMSNHVHLLFTPGEPQACGPLMRDLGQRYVQYFNRRYQRRGTLWEGRFRSCIVASASYVIACYRYIELNPVRAGLVPHPAAYPWSSHRANAGIACDRLVEPHVEYLALGLERPARTSAYRGLFAERLDEKLIERIRASTSGGYALAEESFKAEVLAPLGARTERGKPGPKAKNRIRALTPNSVTSAAR